VRFALETLVNKRDFLKTTAALAVAPAIISRTKLAAASTAGRQVMRAERKKLGPTPSYIFDSDKNSMTFFKADINSFSTYAYMSA
jgi:hypothetical protein